MAAPRKDIDGQHWTKVRELWIRKDKELCESWKDEVQNVLIFSALFSAVVTAFLIESYKHLRPDPTEESVQLLRQISAQLAGQNYVGQAGPRSEHAFYICVNILWFLSLVLSITAALIGIVSLQWIRTHLSSLSDGSESLGLSHMHSLGLQQSFIPVVFTSLPFILLLGLVFFLLGLVLFLFDISWPVAIPVAVAIACTFAFLLITTTHPGLQPLPVHQSADEPDCFPSLYRSPQSLLFLKFVTIWKRWVIDGRINLYRGEDWTSRSQIWLQKRKKDFVQSKQLSHLVLKPEGIKVEQFAYDTIEALVSVKGSRSAESENERMALAKCLAEVLPIYLDLFPSTGDLEDLVPFLPTSEFVPSAVFLREESATKEVLSAMALLQIATCRKGQQPSQSAVIVEACVLTTRWLFELPRTFDSVPDSQPLALISKPSELSLGDLEVLIATLTRFFSFAASFKPDSQLISKTTHMSSYTYWFLVRSADILTQCSLPQDLLEEFQNRHAIIMDVIAIQLRDGNERDYLFLTASIYAGIIATRSSQICFSENRRYFLHAVKCYRSDFPKLKGDPNRQRLQQALRYYEVVWAAIDRALG